MNIEERRKLLSEWREKLKEKGVDLDAKPASMFGKVVSSLFTKKPKPPTLTDLELQAYETVAFVNKLCEWLVKNNGIYPEILTEINGSFDELKSKVDNISSKNSDLEEDGTDEVCNKILQGCDKIVKGVFQARGIKEADNAFTESKINIPPPPNRTPPPLPRQNNSSTHHIFSDDEPAQEPSAPPGLTKTDKPYYEHSGQPKPPPPPPSLPLRTDPPPTGPLPDDVVYGATYEPKHIRRAKPQPPEKPAFLQTEPAATKLDPATYAKREERKTLSTPEASNVIESIKEQLSTTVTPPTTVIPPPPPRVAPMPSNTSDSSKDIETALANAKAAFNSADINKLLMDKNSENEVTGQFVGLLEEVKNSLNGVTADSSNDKFYGACGALVYKKFTKESEEDSEESTEQTLFEHFCSDKDGRRNLLQEPLKAVVALTTALAKKEASKEVAVQILDDEFEQMTVAKILGKMQAAITSDTMAHVDADTTTPYAATIYLAMLREDFASGVSDLNKEALNLNIGLFIDQCKDYFVEGNNEIESAKKLKDAFDQALLMVDKVLDVKIAENERKQFKLFAEEQLAQHAANAVLSSPAITVDDINRAVFMSKQKNAVDILKDSDIVESGGRGYCGDRSIIQSMRDAVRSGNIKLTSLPNELHAILQHRDEVGKEKAITLEYAKKFRKEYVEYLRRESQRLPELSKIGNDKQVYWLEEADMDAIAKWLNTTLTVVQETDTGITTPHKYNESKAGKSAPIGEIKIFNYGNIHYQALLPKNRVAPKDVVADKPPVSSELKKKLEKTLSKAPNVDKTPPTTIESTTTTTAGLRQRFTNRLKGLRGVTTKQTKPGFVGPAPTIPAAKPTPATTTPVAPTTPDAKPTLAKTTPAVPPTLAAEIRPVADTTTVLPASFGVHIAPRPVIVEALVTLVRRILDADKTEKKTGLDYDATTARADRLEIYATVTDAGKPKTAVAIVTNRKATDPEGKLGTITAVNTTEIATLEAMQATLKLIDNMPQEERDKNIHPISVRNITTPEQVMGVTKAWFEYCQKNRHDTDVLANQVDALHDIYIMQDGSEAFKQALYKFLDKLPDKPYGADEHAKNGQYKSFVQGLLKHSTERTTVATSRKFGRHPPLTAAPPLPYQRLLGLLDGYKPPKSIMERAASVLMPTSPKGSVPKHPGS